MQSQRERRRSPRAKASFPVELTFRGRTIPAQLKDLSEHGLCCTYPHAIDEMTLVELTLALPNVPHGGPSAEIAEMAVDDDERNVRSTRREASALGTRACPIRGAVVRCLKRKPEEIEADEADGDAIPAYEIAVYFTELHDETRRAIRTFVNHSMRSIR